MENTGNHKNIIPQEITAINLNQLVKFHYGPAMLQSKTGRKIWYIDITYDLKTMKLQH